MEQEIQHKRSFTLIELLVVIAIIGLLSSVILVSLSGPRQRARITRSLEFSQSVQHTIGNEAVGVWDFDDCTAKDLSGYKNNGTINGAVCVDDTPYKVVGSGQGKNALSFDGNDDYVEIPYSSIFDLGTSNFTIGVWINTSQPTQNRPIIEWGTYNANGFVLRLNEPNSSFPITIYINNTRYSWNYTFSANTWYYLNIGRASTTAVEAFVNGVSFGSQTIPAGTTITANGGVTRIGQITSGGAAGPWIGKIDEVRLYATALTFGQIQNLYLTGLKTHQQLTIK